MSASLARIVERFASKRVLVLGDAMLDTYLLGTSERQCQEAPVPVVAVHARCDYPGGAANTAANLAALGCQVDLLSVVGADYEGSLLRELLRRRGVGTRLLTVTETRGTLSKQRIVNGNRLLARVDCGDTGLIRAHVERRLLAHLDTAFLQADAVVVSDYGYGVITASLLARLQTLQQRFRQLIAVDARDLTQYHSVGVTLVKPNYGEAVRLAQLTTEPVGVSRVAVAAGIGETVLARSGAQIAAITLDRDGSIVLERGRSPHRTIATPADQARASGAGDTYLAALTLALASGATTPEAADIAACAADVVVRQDGTAACSASDIRQALRRTKPVSVPLGAGVQHDSGVADTTISEDGDGQDDSPELGVRKASALRPA